MSRKFLVSIDHNKLEALNFRFQNLASDPGSPVAGQVYYKTGTNKVTWFNGTVFVDPTDRGQHTGTQLAATISDLSTTVQAYRLDQFAAPTASVSANSQKITNLASGTVASDAVNYGQLLNVMNGTDWKASVRVASTANIASLSGLLTIDGITLVGGDRILVKDNTTGAQNGIYLANSGAWTRSLDADTATNADGTSKLSPDTTVFVEEGTTNADTQWRITTNGAIVVGTTSTTWAQIGAGTSYTNGTGINIAGSVINVDTTVVARKALFTIGDGSTTAIVVTHALGTQDVVVSVRDASTNAVVDVDWASTSTTQVTLTFAVAPAASSYKVTIIG